MPNVSDFSFRTLGVKQKKTLNISVFCDTRVGGSEN